MEERESHWEEIQRRQFRFILRITGYALLAVVLGYVAFRLSDIWPTIFTALFLTIILAPFVSQLERVGFPRWLATTLVYIVLFGAIIGLLFLLIPATSESISKILTSLQANTGGAGVETGTGTPDANNGDIITAKANEWLTKTSHQYPFIKTMKAPLLDAVTNASKGLVTALTGFGTFLLNLLPNLFYFFIVAPILAFYALVDYYRIFYWMLALFPERSRDTVRNLGGEVTVVFGRYVRGMGLVSLMTGSVTTIALAIHPVTQKYAIAIGVITAVMYPVPYLGAAIATLLTILAAWNPQNGSIGVMLSIIIPLLILRHIVLDQIIAPRILGDGVGLHPLLCIVALLAGYALFGIGGTLLAVPIAASIQVMLLYLIPRLSQSPEIPVVESEMPTDLIDENEPLPDFQTDLRGEVTAPRTVTGFDTVGVSVR